MHFGWYSALYCLANIFAKQNSLLSSSMKLAPGVRPPAESLGNAPCWGPGQKQLSQKLQGYEVLKASKRYYGSLFLN